MPAASHRAQQSDDIITVEAAASLVGKQRLAMYRAIRNGNVPRGVFWRVGRDIYVSRSRLLAWRDAGGTAAPAELVGAACA